MAETTIWRAQAGTTPPESYERYFVPAIGRPFATDLVREAALRPGERVLDVGCGTGVVARLAAEQVGARGEVTGVDVNPGMLAVARRTAAAEGASIQWYETAAESMPLPDEAFDVILCQMALQFMTDRSAALAEMHRVLAPGGRILLNLPRPSAFFDLLERALALHAGAEAAGFVGAVFSLNEPQRIDELLRTAGFRGVDVRTQSRRLRLPAAGAFLWQYVHSTPLTGLLAGMQEEGRRALEDDVVAAWRPWIEGDALTCEQQVIVASASR
jgi:SAM-dependent methyltransferase